MLSYFLFLGLSIVQLHSPLAVADSRKSYTLAVVPQFTSTQVYRDWTPLLAQLERSTGIHFELMVYEDFARFEADFAKGVPDLVYFNPYHMVIAQKKQRYRPLLRDSGALSGILVIQKDSPITSIKELEGKTIAFPSPNALGASLYIRALLTEQFKIKFNPVYLSNHQNVYRHVILGDASAGGGIQKTLGKEPESVQSQLKVIFSTPEIASHPLAAHPRVSTEASKKIVTALIEMSENPETGKLLGAIQIPKPVEANFKRDYSGLVKLRLEHYSVAESK